MKKKGQESIGMSYGFIMSLIIIIVIVVVAIFAIQKFLGLNQCAKAGLFFDDFQEEVDRAWNSNRFVGYFEGTPPQGTDFVCFGNLTIDSTTGDSNRQDYFIEQDF